VTPRRGRPAGVFPGRFLGVCLLLGACAQAPDAGSPPMTPAVTPAGAAAGNPAQTASAADVRSTPAPTPEPEKVFPPPERLMGLAGGELLDLLGRPRFKRRDDPAEIWQYRTDACALDLFLYRAADGNTFTVRHMETRNMNGAGLGARECVARLFRAHEERRAG